eukprot:5362190-Heterocapsa_arctica.AAC.1
MPSVRSKRTPLVATSRGTSKGIQYRKGVHGTRSCRGTKACHETIESQDPRKRPRNWRHSVWTDSDSMSCVSKSGFGALRTLEK